MAEPVEPTEPNPTPAPENNAPQTPTDGGNGDWKAKYEASQVELNKVTMERNMLRNSNSELTTDATKKVEAAVKEKEELQVKYDALNKEVETSKKQGAIEAKKSELLSAYPDGVRELAADLGIDLTDADDADALTSYTAKLDKIKERVDANPDEGTPPPKPKPQPKPTGNNPSNENREQRQKTETEEMDELAARLENVTF